MEIYLVGGAVRDALLGLAGSDRDWVVVGASVDQMLALGYQPVGRDFPVFLHPVTHEEYALARTERKTAPGYRGFAVHASPEVTLEEDLARRDLTINAIAARALPTGTAGQFTCDFESLIDPFHGRADLQRRVLRHVTDAFREDPVRILRVARFAARFPGFTVADETLRLLRAMVAAGETDHLVSERVWQELARGLMAQQPSRMLEMLRSCGLQPWGQRLDFSAKRLQVLDQAAARELRLPERFALLCLELQPPQLRSLCEHLRVPVECRELAELLLAEHQALLHSADADATTLLRLLQRCDALRRPERFSSALRACSCEADAAVPAPSAAHASLERLRQAQQAAAAVDTASVAARAAQMGLAGPQVGEAIFQARLAAVASTATRK